MDGSPVTFIILIITGLVTWQGFRSRDVMERLIFRPERILVGKEYHRLVSSALIHADWWHFGFNAYSFYMFAPALENPIYGPHILLLVYLGSIVGGSVLSLIIHRHDHYAALGASGGVCGVIFATTFLYPGIQVGLFFVPMPGWVAAVVFVTVSFLGVRGRWGNIGHDAHLGGALVGLAIAFLAYPEIVLASGWRLGLVAGLGITALVLLVQFPQGVGKRLLVGDAREHKPSLRYQDYDRARERNAMKQRLDQLLDKIARDGLEALSADERRELDTLSKMRLR